MPEADPQGLLPAGPRQAFTPHKWWLHVSLFLTTCATTFYAGTFTGGEILSIPDGLMYMSAIMGILLFHEMGHFTAARLHRVDASLPYFIPMPLPPIGTFGAVIRMRRPPKTRASLMDIGAAGPLAGLLIAVPVCFVGLKLSPVRPLTDLPEGAILEGNSLLYLLLKHLAHPEMGPGDDVFLHPLAWAGWIGLLVTSLNLLPAGQLDGGHVLYALLGPTNHRRVARLVRRSVFAMGCIGLTCQILVLTDPTLAWLQQHRLDDLALRAVGMLPWLVWALLLRYVGRGHPPVEDELAALSPMRKVVAWIALATLALTFSPVFLSQVRT